MQIETTVRCHLALFGMAVMKKRRDNKCWEGIEKREPFGGTLPKMVWK
jgi:hypothetical protein